MSWMLVLVLVPRSDISPLLINVALCKRSLNNRLPMDYLVQTDSPGIRGTLSGALRSIIHTRKCRICNTLFLLHIFRDEYP